LPFTARKGFLKKSEGGGVEASEGEADAAFFHRNEKGIITDNLLIKGNNLLALHTIKKEFSGQIKLIYIDPPYNTGNDGFKYNDSFNHSTWLTFMKNRLEIARELLRDDGVIFVQCDDNEQAYLKVLMDEIFGRENFVINLVWQNREGGGKSDSKFFRKKHEYILVYAKNSNSASINPIDVEDIDRYTLSDKYIKTRGKYQLIKLDSGSLGWVKSLDYPIELEGKIFYAGGNKEKWENRQKGGASIKDWGWRWRWSKEKLEWGLKNDFVEIKEGQRGVWNIYTKQYLNCDDDGNLTPRKIQPIGVIDKFSTTQSNRHMKELFGNAIFNYSKPEDYLKFVVDITCAENDIVLDFFVGSGTTAAVAHKMNRQYIGIEQMDYIETIAKERLKKVIDGEQGGISKSVSWQGGGSFIYLELLEWNERIIQSIQTAKQTSELLEIYRNAKTQEFMRYEIEDFNEADFGKLSLKEQKKILCDCLDKNHLYVNLSEIDDKKYEVSEKDKALNKEFYREHK
jgi:adenine-specific DNA-methyltransferase